MIGCNMATESFFEDMVIDSPEAIANLIDLIESGVGWERGDSVIVYADMGGELARRIKEKYSPR